MAKKTAAAKNASASSSASEPAKKGKSSTPVADQQRAAGKADHEAVTYGALRAIHGEGGSIEHAGEEPGEE